MKTKTKTNNLLLLGLVVLIPLHSLKADFLPVCQRTEQVKKFLEKSLKKTCDLITAEDLLILKRVAVDRTNVVAFQKDDFSGLFNLEILNIRSNPFTELPEGLFKDLRKLNTLVIIGGKIRHYPDDFLADTPEMTHIHIFNTPLKSISESVFQRLGNMKHLKEIDFDFTLNEAEKARLLEMFPPTSGVALSLI